MGRSVLNLTFHGIGEPPHPLGPDRNVWLEAGGFERALDAVAERSDIGLSFDDGNASDIEIALPALRARGLRADFFVCAGKLGESGYLDASGLRDLAGAGMRIGSHGLDHRPWRRLDPDALEAELVGARREIERASGRPVNSAACPFGAYDRRSLTGLRRCGYERVFTSDGGWARTDAWLQPRNSLRRDEDPREQIAALDRRRSPSRRLVDDAKRAIKRWR